MGTDDAARLAAVRTIDDGCLAPLAAGAGRACSTAGEPPVRLSARGRRISAEFG